MIFMQRVNSKSHTSVALSVREIRMQLARREAEAARWERSSELSIDGCSMSE